MVAIEVVNPGKIVYQNLKSWKYRLCQDYTSIVPILPPNDIELHFWDDPMTRLTKGGLLTIYAGYCWDGPSGPTVDTKNFMRGSLVHDVFYQFMRKGILPADPYKDKADRLLETICKEDGMSAFRAWYVYWGVRVGGGSACKPGFDPTYQEIIAP